MLILTAAVLMISSSMNSNITQRTKFFGMMRCLGMSRQQIIRFVRLEALNWCKTAIPAGVALGIAVTWCLCAALRFLSVKNSPASSIRHQHARYCQRNRCGYRYSITRRRSSRKTGCKSISCHSSFRQFTK